MFWERSDSNLKNGELQELRSTDYNIHSAMRKLDGEGFFYQKSTSIYDTTIKGTFNRIAKVSTSEYLSSTEYAVKFNINPATSAKSLHLEQWINNRAVSYQFPTPPIVYIDTTKRECPYFYQVTEWAKGIRLREADENLVNLALNKLGKELYNLHSIPLDEKYGRVNLDLYGDWNDFWTAELDHHIDYLFNNNVISQNDKDDISKLLEIIESTGFEINKPSILHGDLSYDNILVNKDGNISVIDWEDAVLGDPVFELAGLATFHPIERHHYFIDSYYDFVGKPGDFSYRFWIYYLRIAIAKAVHRHRFGYIDAYKNGHLLASDRIGIAINQLKNL